MISNGKHWLQSGALTLSLALLTAGCDMYYGNLPHEAGGGVGGGEVVPDTSPPLSPQPDTCDAQLPENEVILDCNVSAGYEVDSFTRDTAGDTALHLVSVYETVSSPAGQSNPDPGRGDVYFALPGSNVLALSAYGANDWVVEVAPGAGLEKIVVFGYEVQTVTAPAGIPVEIYDYEGTNSGYASCGYSMPYNGGGCDTNELIANVEAVTGLSVTTFNGCYEASQFRLERSPVPDECQPGPPAVGAVQDCDGETWMWRTDESTDSNLYIGAVYQTRDDHSFDYHPMGAADVTFELPGDNVLVLSSYEPTTWNVSLTPGANLSGIVVFGYHEQVVDAPAGIPVEIHDYEARNSPLASCGYSYPPNGEGCDTYELIANAESITGRTMTGFDGCYDATQFVYYAQ